MAQVNPLTREVLVKLVYYGPGLCGKTTSLQKIHAASPPETRGQIVSLATPVDRTLYFDFLPLRAQSVRGHHLRLQLFTVPGQVYFNATRKLVLTGADGIIFVADSQRDRMDANLESLENLSSNLEDHQRSLANIPLVLQYNKRDLPTAVSVEEMDSALNALGVPTVLTNASKGEGVLEALDTLVRLVLEDLERRNVLGSVPPPAPQTPKFARPEPGFAQQVELASQELKLPPDEQSKPTNTGVSEHTPIVAPASSPPPAPVVSEKPSVRPDKQPTRPDRQSTRPDRRSSSPPTLVSDDVTSESDILRPTVAPPAPLFSQRAINGSGISFAPLFLDDADDIRALENALAEARYAQVIELAGALARRVLLVAAADAELPDSAVHPVLVAPLVGIEGPRYLRFERVVRRAETGGPVDHHDALLAYAFLLELRSRADRAG